VHVRLLRHAVTTFIQLSRPPRDMGRMWSQVSLNGVKPWPQKAQTKRSRLKSSRLLSGGTALKPLMASALPRIAMIELAVMLERSPVRCEQPPHTVKASRPSSQATRSLA
jgi:hypothetical protein